jgi:beta-barrel assembly-enhancing protease
MKVVIFCASIVLFAGSADAFDLGGMLQNINGQDVKKALSIGQKMTEASKEVSEPQEIEIGDGIAANLLGATPLVRDEALQKYVNRVGLWLALQSERPALPWRFGVTEDAAVNAFGAPGGTILITRGLYEKFRNESELAGVLAHEIAHIVQKHQLKAIKTELGREWQTELATAAAQKTTGANAGYQLKAFTAGTELFARGLDKGDEFEADRMGVVIAARAGYNPYGLVGALQTLDAIKPEDGSVALLFKTHPAPARRLEKLSAAMGTTLDGYADAATEPPRFRALKPQ